MFLTSDGTQTDNTHEILRKPTVAFILRLKEEVLTLNILL
jgi:hypothetical protein